MKWGEIITSQEYQYPIGKSRDRVKVNTPVT